MKSYKINYHWQKIRFAINNVKLVEQKRDQVVNNRSEKKI
jgi:hypothetical protein